MLKINWKESFRTPVFWINAIIAFLAPILVYYKVSFKDFTSWDKVFKFIIEIIKNPYVLMIAFISLCNSIFNTKITDINN